MFLIVFRFFYNCAMDAWRKRHGQPAPSDARRGANPRHRRRQEDNNDNNDGALEMSELYVHEEVRLLVSC